MKKQLIGELRGVQAFFERSIDCLTETDSNFKPKDGMFTVALHVAHVAQTVDWFIDGMNSPAGFDLNFEEHCKKIAGFNSLSEARAFFAQAIKRAIEAIEKSTEEDLLQPLPDGPVMGGLPKYNVVGGIADHTAHHRGALTVYARLLGKTPSMPYA